MQDAINHGKTRTKEETKMKNSLSRKTAYMGAGAGLVLFAIFGLLPGSLIGGAAGLKFASMLFSLPLEAGIISRIIVLASMLMGVVVSGIAIVTAAASIGWLMGRVIDASVRQTAPGAAVIIRNK
jgi:small-conductance mechanosensitive channel